LKRTMAVVAVAMIVVAAGAAQAATVTFAGADVTTNDAWRTTDLAKALDTDGDNVYGTQGYGLFGSATYSSPPVYATFANLQPDSLWESHFQHLDDPTQTGLAPVPDTTSSGLWGDWYGEGDLGEKDILSITVTAAGSFRVGFITDNCDQEVMSPSDIRLRQTVGGSADSGLISAADDRDLDVDYYFFDVIGAQVDDVFVVSGVAFAGNKHNGLAGITFDAAGGGDIPEPATIAILGMGALGAMLRRKRPSGTSPRVRRQR